MADLQKLVDELSGLTVLEAAELSWNGHNLAYAFPSDGGLTCVGMDTAARQAEAVAQTFGSSSFWGTDHADARDAVTISRFETTLRGAADLRGFVGSAA